MSRCIRIVNSTIGNIVIIPFDEFSIEITIFHDQTVRDGNIEIFQNEKNVTRQYIDSTADVLYINPNGVNLANVLTLLQMLKYEPEKEGDDK